MQILENESFKSTTSKIANIKNLAEVVGHLDGLKARGFSHFVLQGDLASGKTTLVQSYARKNGVKESVTSPTFSLHQSYGEIHHYDIYNRELDELLALGILELFSERGVHFIEWGDERLVALLCEIGFNVAVVKISTCDKGRKYEFEVKCA